MTDIHQQTAALLERRRMLGTLGSIGVASLFGCVGSGGDGNDSGASSSSSASGSTTSAGSANLSGCALIPEETHRVVSAQPRQQCRVFPQGCHRGQGRQPL